MSDNKEAAIIVKDLHKSFKLPHEQHSSIKQRIVNVFNSKRGYEEQKVLKGISFEIEKGDFFGIVGRNGGGKSTLLKLLAGIYSPDKGLVHINGSLTPFIELGVGFNPELTGRENVFLNGALLGFDKKQMLEMYDEIVQFAELNDFMDQKLKNYSSGMQVRLAFSIAIKAQSDILLLDEVLAVGDETFQRKCYSYFNDLKKSGKTVILVTHDMNAVQRFCNKALLIDRGKVNLIGSPNKVSARYSRINLEAINTNNNTNKNHENTQERFGNGAAELNIRLLDQNEKTSKIFSPNESIIISINVVANELLKNPRIGFVIYNESDAIVYATNTLVENFNLNDIEKDSRVTINFSIKNIFTDGDYIVSGAVASNNDETIYKRVERASKFSSGGWLLKHSLVHPTCSIKLHKY